MAADREQMLPFIGRACDLLKARKDMGETVYTQKMDALIAEAAEVDAERSLNWWVYYEDHEGPEQEILKGPLYPPVSPGVLMSRLGQRGGSIQREQDLSAAVVAFAKQEQDYADIGGAVYVLVKPVDES